MFDHLLILAQIANPFPHVATNQTTVKTILNIVFGVVGGLALLFIVIGGLLYIISNGDSQATARAKDTIIYAAIGLAIVLLATAIVNFVLSKVSGV